jgi:hypothetical protein
VTHTNSRIIRTIHFDQRTVGFLVVVETEPAVHACSAPSTNAALTELGRAGVDPQHDTRTDLTAGRIDDEPPCLSFSAKSLYLVCKQPIFD